MRYRYSSMWGGTKTFFHSSCLLFENSKLHKGNPPSHSLECNVVFIICQAYYKKDYKKTRVVAPRNLKPVQGRASLVI